MIDRKKFVRGDFKKRRHMDHKSHPISMLLKKNKSYALKAEEIAKKIKMNQNTVRSMLRNLIAEGLVLHKAPYFAWK